MIWILVFVKHCIDTITQINYKKVHVEQLVENGGLSINCFMQKDKFV